MEIFEGQTADEAWRKAASVFRDGILSRSRSGRGGQVEELLHSVFVIHNPRQRWVTSRCPPINPAFAIAEVVWILAGRRDSRFLNYWNPILPKFAGNAEDYHGAYGYRLRHHFQIDQLERAYMALRQNPSGRQVVLQIWDPKSDFPRTNGHPSSADVPCNVCALLKVRDKKLEWTQVLRSNDLFLGAPHNFVQFTMLQEILSGWLNVQLGDYTQLSDSLHVYKSDARYIRKFKKVEAGHNTDILSLSKKQSDRAIRELETRLSKMIAAKLGPRDLREIAAEPGLPRAFANLLLVAAADGARRRGWAEMSCELIEHCDNAILRLLWNRWDARTKGLKITSGFVPKAVEK